MHARFTDPQGPPAWRTVPYMVSIALLLFAIAGPIEGTAAVVLGLTGLVFFYGLGLLPLRQRAPRPAELACGPGWIDVKNAGSRSQRIRARDLGGATTTRTSGGVCFTLQHRRRDQPLTIEVPTEADADRVRQALGIGHSGFGTVAWSTALDPTTHAAFVGRLIATVTGTLLIACVLALEGEALTFAATLLGLFGFVGAALGLVGVAAGRRGPTVVMTAAGMRLRTPRGWFALPYDAITSVLDRPDGLVFAVPPPYGRVAVEHGSPAFGGLAARDRRVLVAQVLSAAQRARGLGPHKEDVSGRLDVLRRQGESPRDWLVRLDVAGQMLAAGMGYRGNPLDPQDLWALLEDPDADPDLRAAAARVLRHHGAPDTRVRIDAAVAAVRDERTHQRLRIAITDDLDGATQELANLDATAPAPRRAHTGGAGAALPRRP